MFLFDTLQQMVLFVVACAFFFVNQSLLEYCIVLYCRSRKNEKHQPVVVLYSTIPYHIAQYGIVPIPVEYWYNTSKISVD